MAACRPLAPIPPPWGCLFSFFFFSKEFHISYFKRQTEFQKKSFPLSPKIKHPGTAKNRVRGGPVYSPRQDHASAAERVALSCSDAFSAVFSRSIPTLVPTASARITTASAPFATASAPLATASAPLRISAATSAAFAVASAAEESRSKHAARP